MLVGTLLVSGLPTSAMGGNWRSTVKHGFNVVGKKIIPQSAVAKARLRRTMGVGEVFTGILFNAVGLPLTHVGLKSGSWDVGLTGLTITFLGTHFALRGLEHVEVPKPTDRVGEKK